MEFRDFIITLSTPQLRAIRQVLVSGAKANAEETVTVKNLQKALANLKHEKRWRAIVESYGLEFDNPKYWLSFKTESELRWICNKLATAKTEAANAEVKNTLRIPPIFVGEKLGTKDAVRQGFADMKTRRNGGSEN